MGQGSATIVLDAGAGNDSLTWAGTQPKLTLQTQVCSYDRAGLGSSASGPYPRDADHVATEFHGLLAAAHIPSPVVLMGHSHRGLFLCDYAGHTPLRSPWAGLYSCRMAGTPTGSVYQKVIFPVS
jgi:hypothetical protein